MNVTHSHRELFYHLIWATKNRYPFIGQSVRTPLLGLLRDKAAQLGCQVFAAGGVPDHVHLLLYIPPGLTVARAVRELKGFSSHGLRLYCLDFGWQAGYGAITLRRSDLATVEAYIADQDRHHNQPGMPDPLLEEITDEDPPA